jgi:hypothetical protein
MPQEPLALLEGYVAREGDALVPKDHVEDGFALGQWVARRRLAYQLEPEASGFAHGASRIMRRVILIQSEVVGHCLAGEPGPWVWWRCPAIWSVRTATRSGD